MLSIIIHIFCVGVLQQSYTRELLHHFSNAISPYAVNQCLIPVRQLPHIPRHLLYLSAWNLIWILERLLRAIAHLHLHLQPTPKAKPTEEAAIPQG